MGRVLWASGDGAGLRVEIEESLNVVLVEPRLAGDVRILLGNVNGLRRALEDALQMRAVFEEQSWTASP